ncbi:Gluconate 2-dehydrogenase (acceptor) (plasmid) [Ketogulonicigenium vulgare Y25]|uniref:Sorbitol dehydrogenase cytochrome c subunit n=1 Tax=Ketogulonicigenium vulgare (strain WSH-001) TaxID=759362 RepID=F9YBD5_KETVW|nr:cytochrome c [Ketogulonicigenium vulgare]ADO44250.1 Gluconate 2-dehydrogenase (acceptor) [Ketogulonicigenium vulgare Y25]AEM42687.1 Sorbitol dehydrogenase cytochrome c subunit [Ketogulonicigenium vulgare WSH-001]ALJ82861.1 sorbitol dehydrogenase [Ketogulonicigenium vulgare]
MTHRFMTTLAVSMLLAAPALAQDADQLAHGRSLVETNNCTGCHTQNLGGQFFGGWYVPNISSDEASGVGSWTADELVAYLRDGTSAKGQAAGSMAGVVGSITRHMPDADLQAIAAYLKSSDPVVSFERTTEAAAPGSFVDAKPASLASLDPVQSTDPAAHVDLSVTDGATLYISACATCHMPNGEGIEGQFYPALTGNTTTGTYVPNNLVQVILYGVTRDSNRGMPVHMPAFGNDLSDEQIAAVANYVFDRFGNDDLSVSGDDVALLRARQNLPGQQ